MRWMMFAVILGSLLPAASGAARADDASRLKLAREIVVVTHTADNMRKIMPTVMGQVRTMLIQQHAGDKKMIDAVLNRSTQHIDEQIDGFVDLAAEVYAREFTEEDLQALLAFDHTPAGQHLIEKQPVIAQAMMVTGQKWGQLVAKQAIDEISKEKAEVPAPKL